MLVPSVALTNDTPVMLPPGRSEVCDKPTFTGSSPVKNTIGIVVVALLAGQRPDGAEGGDHGCRPADQLRRQLAADRPDWMPSGIVRLV